MKQKILLLILLFFIIPSSSCSKDDTTDPANPSSPAVPEDTVLAIPFGESTQADLDGDGTSEKVSMRVSLIPGHDLNGWHDALPELIVGENVFDGEYFYKLLGSGRMDVEAWYLLNVDQADSFYEIGIFWEAMPQHAETVLLRCKDGELVKIGSFNGKLLDSPLHFPNKEEPDWQALKKEMGSVKKGAVPGDGSIHSLEACNILEWDFAMQTWKLENKESLQASLVLAEQETCEFESWNDAGRQKILKAECRFYTKRDAGEEDTVLLPAGTKVRFRKYEANGNWIEMTYQDGTAEKEAWFQVVKEWNNEEDTAVIRLPEGEKDAVSCFEGLQVEGG